MKPVSASSAMAHGHRSGSVTTAGSRSLRALALSCVLLPLPCGAHEDTPLQVSPDGSLTGLPQRYGSARLSIEFEPLSVEQPVQALKFSIDGRLTVVPECVTSLLQTRFLGQAHVTASGYHDLTLLPPYLQVRLHDHTFDEQSAFNHGYRMLFSLKTSELLQIDILLPDRGRTSAAELPIDVGKLCERD